MAGLVLCVRAREHHCTEKDHLSQHMRARGWEKASLGQGSHRRLTSPVRWPLGNPNWSRQPRGSNTFAAEEKHPQTES